MELCAQKHRARPQASGSYDTIGQENVALHKLRDGKRWNSATRLKGCAPLGCDALRLQSSPALPRASG